MVEYLTDPLVDICSWVMDWFYRLTNCFADMVRVGLTDWLLGFKVDWTAVRYGLIGWLVDLRCID